MELVLAVFPLKTWIFAAGFGGLFTVFKTKYSNFKLGKEYEKNLKEIKKNYFYSIRNDLQNKKEEYIKENLADYDIRKLQELVQNVFKDEKFSELIQAKVKEFIDKMNFETHTSHFNILVLGSTGVGKSTLINSVLKLDEKSPNAAKVGKGKPVTLGEPRSYISDKVKGLKLWDTQGIDKSGYDITKLKESVVNLINNNANENNPDNFIHCLWYCVSAHRFETVERDFLIELMKVYHDETLPIIIAYTQCVSEENGESMSKEIKKICMEQNRKLEVIPVLAQDMNVGRKNNPTLVEKFGIDKLLESSFKKIEGAVQSACFHSIREQIKTNYKASIKKNMQKVNERMKAQLSTLNSNQNLNQLKDKILKMFEVIIKTLIFEEDETKSLSENSKLNLLNFLAEYVQICTEKLNEFMKKKVVEKSIELANSYFINQKDIKEKSDKINEGIITNLTNKIMDNVSLFQSIGLDTGSKDIKSKFKEMDEWKKLSEDEITKEFNEKIEIFFNKGITKFIIGEFINILTETMVNSFNTTLEKIDNYMVEKTGEQVKEISKNIIKELKGN